MESISNEAITEKLTAAIPGATIEVMGDGYKYQAIVISDTFEGLSTVKRHQKVYAVLNEAIASGALHALTLKTYTPREYQEQTKEKS